MLSLSSDWINQFYFFQIRLLLVFHSSIFQTNFSTSSYPAIMALYQSDRNGSTTIIEYKIHNKSTDREYEFISLSYHKIFTLCLFYRSFWQFLQTSKLMDMKTNRLK